MSVTLATLPLFILAGLLAGFMNTVAGGGSLLSFPLLILLGFPAQIANGTLRVSILMQNLVAVPTYARHGFFLPKQSLALAAFAVPTAILGAKVAVLLDPEPFRNVAAILLLCVLSTIFLSPSKWTREEALEKIRWKLALPGAAVVGFYGGFFQLGAGLPFLAMAVLGGGWDLRSANALKVTVILIYTAVSLWVFAAHGQVDWTAGVALGGGSMIGAWIGAKTAIKKGPGWIRWVLVTMAVVAAAKMLLQG